ncbi:transcriptional regulator [Dyella lipolytica]|uniref:WYL domain-containing protein n=1 Tax=Dyella lipolytica TaxID=1867835 RepID=A0ABW8IX80_9GAMM|nr:WYL domain-containing protein [Dyella lipolytica]GLQ48456.1 transcriptional regulator [Dyella lipolytica]
MLASRLLSILMLLQTRGRMSATQLAAELEVTVRTIHRDIDQLSAAGVPVYADRGRNGGFQLQDGYRTMLTGLNQSEAETLFLAGLPGPAAQMGLADVLSTARLKLLAALPANIQPSAERIAARFHLDAGAWFHSVDQLPSLPVIAHAVWGERMLKMRYQPSGEPDARTRTVAPLGLVLKSGIWYLVAQNSRSVCTYRAANIYDAEVCDETFTRPKQFDLVAHWERSVRDYEASVYRDYADVRLSPVGLKRLSLLGPYVTSSASSTAGKPDRKGWVRCRLPIESLDFGIRELLRLGDEVVVIGPPVLRAQLAQTADRIARLHSTRIAKRGH